MLLTNKLNNNRQMDIRDFEGLTKFKVIIPALYIISWISMFMGPSLFPVVYQRFSIFMILYILAKIMMVFFTMFYVTLRGYSQVSRAKTDQVSQPDCELPEITEQINYAFIIPNYKEEIELLVQTLDLLASHKRAGTHYLVFMAMEAHEPGSNEKGQKLLSMFRHKFRLMDYSLHQIRQNEQKGKASNVSWCVEHLEPILQKNMIDPDSVMLTIIDADSWVPAIYIDIVEEKIAEDFEDHWKTIYMPNQIFTRNHLDVPIITRTYDILHAFAHNSNMLSFFNMSLPLSNYTISYNMIKRIGFWDTCADAIGEDFHTTLKAYWKTQGDMKTCPIYTPFNQVNIATGNGYWEDCKARFWQAQRHAKGVADVAWCLKMTLNQPFRLKNLYIMYTVFQTFAITAFVPWVMISMNYQQKILYMYEKPSPHLYDQEAVSYLFTFMSIFGTMAYLFFEFNKRRANRIIYKQENESLLRLLEYPILFMFIFFTMGVPSFVIAAFATLLGHQEYIVADKKITSKNESTMQNRH